MCARCAQAPFGRLLAVARLRSGRRGRLWGRRLGLERPLSADRRSPKPINSTRMVRPDERSSDRSRYTEPAGVSPARTGIGPSGSRPPGRGEIAVAEAGRRKPLRREQERGPQHQVKPAASTEEQCRSRAEHVAAKAMFAVRESEAIPVASPAGVWGAARAQDSVWTRRDPSARPASGQGGSYKPNVRDEGKCEGMAGTTGLNHPHGRESVAETREPHNELWAGAKWQRRPMSPRSKPVRSDERPGRCAHRDFSASHASSGRPSVSRVLEIGTHGLSGGLTASRLFSGVT